MFYYKTSILLFNCFLFPHIFLHQGKYIIIFSLPLRTGQAYLLRRHPCFTPTTLSPHSRLRNVLRSSAHTVSLPLRSGSALTQALLRNPCPLPPCSPALPIYFFSKFSFLCGSTGSLKSAFIIEELSIFGEQVSPA